MKQKLTLLILTMLFLGVGSMWAEDITYYIPTNRVTTFASDKVYMLYNTCIDGEGDRTGFIYIDGDANMQKYTGTDRNPKQFQTTNTAYLWKVVTGSDNHVSLQNVSNSKYYGYNLAKNDSDPENLYLYQWEESAPGKSGANSQNEDDPSTKTANASITFATNKVFIIGNKDAEGSNTQFWNGNPGDIVTWGNGHPFAFYEVKEVTVPSGYNTYIGSTKTIDETQWKTQNNWVRIDSWNSKGPGCSGSGMWSPIYLKDITGGTVPALEGWNFRMTADHSTYTIASVGKIQSGQGITSYLMLKNTSVVTMNFGDGQQNPFTVNLNEGTGNILNFVLPSTTNYGSSITINYGSVTKNTNRVFNASASANRTINTLTLNATLTDPTEKNAVESITLATLSKITVGTLTPTISGTEGWTLVANKAALETQATDGKYYYVEQSNTSGVTLHTYQRSLYEVPANTTETLSEIADYVTYSLFNVPSGSTLNVDIAGFDLSKIKGAGTVNVYEETVAQVTTAKTQTSNITGTINYFVTGAQTSNIVTNSDNITYTGGAGTSESRVSISHDGGSVKLTGADKTYYLAGSNSNTQSTVNFDGTNVNYSDELGIGKAIYNINNTQITTPKFITSQGGNSRAAVVNLTGNTKITVTGNTNADNNNSSIMIGHWNGSSNLTLNNTAQIEAVDAQMLVGLTRNNQTITLNDNSNITAKGIKTASYATGTNTLNLNGGSLNLGEVGITSYSSSTSIAVNVNVNTTITATAATLPLTQPITVASGKILTIDGGDSNATVTLPSSLTNNGTVSFRNATLTINLSERDLSGYTFTNCTATAQFVETTDEYKAGGFTITNIPSGVTVKVKKYGTTEYETVTPSDGTATISHSVGVSGLAAWLDYTFNESTKATNTGTSGNVIKNAGNAGESGNDLTLDSSNGHQYTPSNSYNEDGTLKVESTPYRTVNWPTNYTVAVAGNVPDVENGCLVAFGTLTGGYLAILRGDASNKILLVKGKGQTAFETITEMTAANATELSHLVVFTKNGNTFTVYLDGVQKAQVTYSETLGNGFQIGSLHGGITSTGIVRVSYMEDATAKAKVFAKAVRVYDYVISEGQMSQLTDEFPYTSFGGKFTRTISENSNLSATDTWLNTSTQGNVDVPGNTVRDAVTYYPDVEITTTANSTLTVNANMDVENLVFKGAGKLTIANDETHKISVYGSVTANGPVSVKYGEIDLSAVPISIGESGSVEFDFSGSDFSSVVTSTDYPVTGNTSDYGSKVTGVYPSDEYHSYTLAFNSTTNSYYLTVAPTIALKKQLAIALVQPYYDGNYVGAGLGKYTISLGETSYANFADFGTAVTSWASLEDYVEPTIAINQPTSAFYRIKNGDKYLKDERKSSGATQRLLTNAEGSNVSAETIFYLYNNKFVGYKTGYGFGYSVCQTQETEYLNTQLFTASAEMGKYTIQSQQGTCTSATNNVGYWGVEGDELSRKANAADGACWTIEAVTSLPITMRESDGAYCATINLPVAVEIPTGLSAYKATASGEVMTLRRLVEGEGVLAANQPVILYSTTDVTSLTISNETGTSAEENTNVLSGTIAAKSVGGNDYVLGKGTQGVGFYKYTGSAIPGFKAYLSTTNPVKAFAFSFEDVEDAIRAIESENNGLEIYDINGRRVQKAQKGLYIVNGKKVMYK